MLRCSLFHPGTCILIAGSLVSAWPLRVLAPAPSPTPTRFLLRSGRLLDVTTGQEPASQTIIVTGDRIAAIAATSATPAAPRDAVIDLTRYSECRA